MSTVTDDSEVDDAEVAEIWEGCYACDWEEQLEERGYVVFSDEHESPADWAAKLVEWRWEPLGPLSSYVPSRMWDAATPSVGGGRPTPQALAHLRRQLEEDDDDFDLDLADVDDDEWLGDEDDE